MSNGDSPEPRAIEGKDIIFECPNCSKSMAIDQSGAGLLVTCPGCDLEIQVPGGKEDTFVDAGTGEGPSIMISQEKIQMLVESFDEINTRREKLEKIRSDSFSRFERIHEQLSIIQSALDRITLILQEAANMR